MEQLDQQDALYRPGPFWAEASKDMVKDLEKNGINAFRHLETSLWYFVPTYGFPGNALPASVMQALDSVVNQDGVTPKQKAYLQQFTSGYSSALADYRTLSAIEYRNDVQPNLMSFSESDIGEPKEHFEIEDKHYSRSALNYLMGMAFLKQYVDFSTIKTVLEIGGGFGTLGEIVYKTMPSTQYIDIDIPPTMCCSSHYLKTLVGDAQFTDYASVAQQEEIPVSALKSMSVLPSWEIAKLTGKVDLFVNFISFQEMEPDIVQNYLNHVKRLGADWVLLRNMREGKQLRSQHRVGVDKPIFSEDYIAMLEGYELVDNNVIPFGFKTVDGFHSELMLFRKKH